MLKTKNKLKSIIAVAGVITLTCSLSNSRPLKVDAADTQSVATATATSTIPTDLYVDGFKLVPCNTEVLDADTYFIAYVDSWYSITHSSSVKVPDAGNINGEYYSVTVLAANSLSGCEASSITLPYNLVNLEDGALSGCANLNSISLPYTLSYIGKHSLSYTGLESITIPDDIYHIADEAFIGNAHLSEFVMNSNYNDKYYVLNKSLFERSTNRLMAVPQFNTNYEYDVPSGTKIIGDGAFYGTILGKVVIPNTVISIDNGGFKDNKNLIELDIPSSVTKISETFETNPNIRIFNVSKDNPNFSSDYNSSLVNKDGTELIRCSSSVGAIYNVDDNITTIDPNAVTNVGVSTISLPSTFDSVNNATNAEFIKNFKGNIILRDATATSSVTADTTTSVSTSSVTADTETPVSTSTATSSTPTNSGVASTTASVAVASSTATTVTTATANQQANTSTSSQSVGTTVQNSTSTATTVSNGSKTGDISSLPYVIATFAGLASSVAIRKRK